ncbi:hypothetical protein, partial [Nitrospirillum iridis]|uniref:hypothetical protein n=1 Tax=Nitrospirillum iridis TaxID=765888 RepID=UPI001B3B93AC
MALEVVVTPPPGTSIAPYGDPYIPLAQAPVSARQILQYRVFFFDDNTGMWGVGFTFPMGGGELTPTIVRRGQDAGTGLALEKWRAICSPSGGSLEQDGTFVAQGRMP